MNDEYQRVINKNILYLASKGIQYDDEDGEETKLGHQVDQFLIELAMDIQMYHRELMRPYIHPKRASDRKIFKRITDGTKVLEEMEISGKVITDQHRNVREFRHRLETDASFRDQFQQGKTWFLNGDLMLHYENLQRRMDRFMYHLQECTGRLILSLNQAQREHIRRRKGFIQWFARVNWNLNIPDDIFTAIAEF